MSGKLVKKDGIIWFVEQQDLYGKHTRWTHMGTYDVEDKPNKSKKTKKEIDE